MIGLLLQEIKADRAGLGALGAQTMTDCFLGVFRHQLLQVGFGGLMLDKGRSGAAETLGELGPGIGSTHIDDPDILEPRPLRLDPEQPGLFAIHHAAPELLFGGEQQVLVQRIGKQRKLNPFAAAGDSPTAPRIWHWPPHMLCCSCGGCFSVAASSENAEGSMNLA
jgi:hypothetical protein